VTIWLHCRARIADDDSCGRLRTNAKSIEIGAGGVSALTGFVFGGGFWGRSGLSVLLFVGRLVIREVISSVVAKALEPNGRGHRQDRRRDRAGAREDLQQTHEKVNQEVEEVGARFSPENLVRRNPLAAACGAATAGLLIGGHNTMGDRVAAP
jgi:hypothetical protein